MKKLIKYVSVLVLMCFSFYYAEKVALLLNKNDKVMKSIQEYAVNNNKECTEGYITSDGVVLGISGLMVDEKLSYSEMKVTGFREDLIEYKEYPCVVSLENNKDNYIIKGNNSKKSVTLIIDVTNGKNIDNIVKISKIKNVKLSILIDYNYLINNKEYINKLIIDGYDILFKGSSDKLSKFIKELNNNTFCVDRGDDNILESCYKNDVNTVKTNKIYKNSFLTNIKENMSIGDFIILEENINLKSEIGVTINYIRSKGIKVITLTEHLSN